MALDFDCLCPSCNITPTEEGVQARRRCVPVNANPYPPNSHAARNWEIGWMVEDLALRTGDDLHAI